MKIGTISLIIGLVCSSAVNAEVLHHTGRVDQSLLEKFEKVKDQIDTVVLEDSEGGDFYVGLYIAKEIRRLGIDTKIPDGKFCYSSCSIMFQGGVSRTIGKTSIMMYHPPNVGESVLQNHVTHCTGEVKAVDCEERFTRLVEYNTKLMNEWLETMTTLGASPTLSFLMTNQLKSEPWGYRGNFTEYSHFTLTGEEAKLINVATHIE